ncbi:MAG: GNAT family N-acetyltransferase [Haloarculaceae archaeon]
MPGDATGGGDAGITVRQARTSDADAVAAFTEDTWEEFEGNDYVPDVFEEWVATDGADQHTVVAERAAGPASERAVVGCCQVVRLSGHEAWTQGIRVHPAHRGAGVGRAMDAACREWARERGATVARNMVFSWNEQGLATARSLGYAPRTEFRWAHPGPDADAAVLAPAGTPERDVAVTNNPDAIWGYWQRSDARDALGGLALDPAEPWALSEWTRERARRAADERAAFAVRRDRTTGIAWRTRVSERDDGHWAEYGGTGWETLVDARALFSAVARDAAAVGADRTRVLVPETPRHVSDAAAAGVELADDPDFVFEADLTDIPR